MDAPGSSSFELMLTVSSLDCDVVHLNFQQSLLSQAAALEEKLSICRPFWSPPLINW